MTVLKLTELVSPAKVSFSRKRYRIFDRKRPFKLENLRLMLENEYFSSC